MVFFLAFVVYPHLFSCLLWLSDLMRQDLVVGFGTFSMSASKYDILISISAAMNKPIDCSEHTHYDNSTRGYIVKKLISSKMPIYSDGVI